MASLIQLAEQYGTDKRPTDHNYVKMYEEIMEETRKSVNNILEVGFGPGASIRMWMDYFPNADVFCIEYFDKEYNEVWKSPSTDIKGLNVVEGDSTLEQTWTDLPSNFDYIIDDGSHFPEHQIATFLNGFPHLKSGGWYFIEDTHCGWEQIYGATDMIYKWAFDLVTKQQTPGRNYGGNFYQCQGAIEGVARDIYSYRFYKSVIAFQKA